MTITNYTFFSPNGDDFPVTANSDGKLYMMLTGMNKGDFRRKDWEDPINSALNRIYVNTSLVVGGRYFELQSESVTMFSETTNYIHAVIDLSDTSAPVTITAEKTNTSNNVDINNGSGILKVCFDIVVTSTSSITSATPTVQNATFGKITTDDMSIKTVITNLAIGNGASIQFQAKGDIVTIRWSGSLTSINSGTAFANKAPVELRPDRTKELVGHYASNDSSFHIDLETDGTFRWWGRNGATGAIRGSAVYFIK